MPKALTLADMSPRLRKGVGRASPRVTSAEEPDGGNLLVRIWRGVGLGDLPAYSTTLLCHSAVGRALPEQPGSVGRRSTLRLRGSARLQHGCEREIGGRLQVIPAALSPADLCGQPRGPRGHGLLVHRQSFPGGGLPIAVGQLLRRLASSDISTAC
jgi:hypothetical protein